MFLGKDTIFFSTGCIDDIRISGEALPLPPTFNHTSWGRVTNLQGLEAGCPAQDACFNTTCLPPLTCHNTWRQATCRYIILFCLAYGLSSHLFIKELLFLSLYQRTSHIPISILVNFGTFMFIASHKIPVRDTSKLHFVIHKIRSLYAIINGVLPTTAVGQDNI